MYNFNLLGMLSSDVLEVVKAIIGFTPYLWQQRLLAELLENRIPSSLDVPTGLGKTVVMGLWLTARALGKPVPRRLFYVVDRRAVVDQATVFAEKIFRNVQESTHEQASKWRVNLGLSGDGLPLSTLRGQFADNRVWLEDPTRSAIVVGTVDMIGSRLLFEGYGVSRRMRPVHAALIGTDSLIVLDEAHLVPSFEALVRSATGFLRPEPVAPMRMLSLSATGRNIDHSTFRLGLEEREEPAVIKRLYGKKELTLQDVEDLPAALADAAFQLGQDGSRVLVFCNSRDKLAKVVAEDLIKRGKKVWPGAETTALLVGARRVINREQLSKNEVFLRFTRSENLKGGLPAFLVATSAGEVGVDLDADHMVCDLVAWERMVQRLGRVNRSGRLDAATIRIFAAAPKEKQDAEDETGDVLDVLRRPFESTFWQADPTGKKEASPGNLSDLKANPEFAYLTELATTQAPLHPELSQPLLDAWSMTSLQDHPGRPIVQPWIRGWIELPSQTRILWRRVLPMRDNTPDQRLLSEYFAAFPPHLTEVLEAETYLILDTLRERAKKLEESKEHDTIQRLAAVVLDPAGEVERWLSLSQLTEREQRGFGGRTIIVSAMVGGLSPDGLLDPKASEEVPTLDVNENLQALWPEERLRNIGRRLKIVNVDEPSSNGWVREAAWPRKLSSSDEVVDEWRIERYRRSQPAAEASVAPKEQSLNEHVEWVVQEAERISAALALPDQYRRMLVECARLHDLGKNRELWQNAMGARIEGRPYAKTNGQNANPRAMGGYRHEFGSFLDAKLDLEKITDVEIRDLASHLILAHHGLSRPSIDPIDPNLPPSLAVNQSIEASIRFARLERRWGAWGVAWWETLLRCADWAASGRAVRTEEEVQ